jgi:hypothetical protein
MIQLKGEKMNEHHKKQMKLLERLKRWGSPRRRRRPCYWLANYPG